MTNKSSTPLLWKVLSKEYRSYLNFGIVKKSGNLLENLKVNRVPTIIGFGHNIFNHKEMKGEMNPHMIRQFLREVIDQMDVSKMNFEIEKIS